MPRTKRVQNKKTATAGSSIMNKKDLVMKIIDDEEAKVLASIEQEMEERLQSLKLGYINLKADIKTSMLKATVKSIQSGEYYSLSDPTVVLSDLSNTLDSTKTFKNTTLIVKKATSQSRGRKRSVTENTRAPIRRSISVGCEDEGYRTAESTSSTASGNTRQSRSKTRSTVKQTFRSVSRTNGKATGYQTPLNMQPVPNAGTITPKCKPNTPQVFLRRPKMGEMAWSNQGSPLLTGPVASEHIANVNIPLDNGVVSLLPQRDIRLSQIPNVDDHTIQQLMVLRDNLIKVCSHVQK